MIMGNEPKSDRAPGDASGGNPMSLDEGISTILPGYENVYSDNFSLSFIVSLSDSSLG